MSPEKIEKVAKLNMPGATEIHEALKNIQMFSRYLAEARAGSEKIQVKNKLIDMNSVIEDLLRNGVILNSTGKTIQNEIAYGKKMLDKEDYDGIYVVLRDIRKTWHEEATVDAISYMKHPKATYSKRKVTE